MSQIAALDDLTLADGELFHDHKGVACPMPAPSRPSRTPMATSRASVSSIPQRRSRVQRSPACVCSWCPSTP